MLMGQIAHAAARAGLGTAMSAGISAEIMNYAQHVREHANQLAQRVEDQGKICTETSQKVRVLKNAHWRSEAARNFHRKIDEHVQSQIDLGDELREAAALIRAAGESIAQKLESLAGSIADAGAWVDATVQEVGANIEQSKQDAAEALNDVLTSGRVRGAQAQLAALTEDPLLVAVRAAYAPRGLAGAL